MRELYRTVSALLLDVSVNGRVHFHCFTGFVFLKTQTYGTDDCTFDVHDNFLFVLIIIGAHS